MEPQIRYVKSADGTRVAVWSLGRGRPLVNGHSIWFTSMESFWHIPEEREGIERLAQSRKVVRFDNRGHGLSEREVTDFSLEARVKDLLAVVNHLGVAPVDMMGTANAAMPAVAFAVAHPDKVRRLILWNAVASGSEYVASDIARALDPMIQVDWETYVRTRAAILFGWNEIGLRVGEASIRSVSPEVFLAAGRATLDYDVTHLLPEVRCPTLVTHRRNSLRPLDASKRLASTIPNARLVTYESKYLLLGSRESREIIEQFLDEEDAPARDGAVPSGTAIILFADIADSTALTETLGDAAFRAKARDLDAALRTTIREHAGTPIEGKLLGDGVLATFASARQAIEAALACARSGDDAGLPLHLGLHAGDVIREENNVYGGAVNIASRISGLAAPGEVLVSETVRSLARTSAGVAFEDRGEQMLKGVGEPVRVWAVREGA